MSIIKNIKHYIELRQYRKVRRPNTFEDLVIDLCYDRKFCESVGIDYNRMNKEDVDKVKEYVNENILRRVKNE